MNVLQLLEFQLILSCIFTFLPKIALWGILCFHQKPRECALPRQVADAASLEVFKTKLDGALKQPGVVWGVPAHVRGVEIR